MSKLTEMKWKQPSSAFPLPNRDLLFFFCGWCQSPKPFVVHTPTPCPHISTHFIRYNKQQREGIPRKLVPILDLTQKVQGRSQGQVKEACVEGIPESEKIDYEI